MVSSLKQIPPNVFLIVDHLDSVLAAAEELAALRLAMPAEMRSDGALAPGSSLTAFVERVRRLELSIMSRALQARERARELRNPPSPLKALVSLFLGGTAALADAVEELGDRRAGDFDTGHDPVAYLRSRGLIAPELGSLQGIAQIEIGDEFLVARRIALGPLMELAAQFLDTLDVCYDLFRADATLTGLSDEREERTAGSSPIDTHSTRA